MGERYTVISDMKLEYEGIVNVNELFRVTDKWFREKGYDKYEKFNVEQHFKDSSEIEMEWEPWKKVTDYTIGFMKIKFLFSDIKDVTVVKDGVKVKMQEAKIQINFESYLGTDWEHKWDKHYIAAFIRTIFDKFFYRKYLEKYMGIVHDDTYHLYTMVQSYLNVVRP
jgi:hypothetical protein